VPIGLQAASILKLASLQQVSRHLLSVKQRVIDLQGNAIEAHLQTIAAHSAAIAEKVEAIGSERRLRIEAEIALTARTTAITLLKSDAAAKEKAIEKERRQRVKTEEAALMLPDQALPSSIEKKFSSSLISGVRGASTSLRWSAKRRPNNDALNGAPDKEITARISAKRSRGHCNAGPSGENVDVSAVLAANKAAACAAPTSEEGQGSPKQARTTVVRAALHHTVDAHLSHIASTCTCETCIMQWQERLPLLLLPA
jgi:hypothetical protein